MKEIEFSSLGLYGFLSAATLTGLVFQVLPLSIVGGGILTALLFFRLVLNKPKAEKVIHENEANASYLDKALVKKYEQVDVRRFANSFLLTGMSIALLSSIYAFSWVGERTALEIPDEMVILDDEEMPPPTNRTPPPPLPPPPPPPTLIDVFPDDEIFDEPQPEIIETDASAETIVEKIEFDIKSHLEDFGKEIYEEPEEIIEDEIIHDFVEVMPEFEGGIQALMKYVYGKIKYPNIAKEMGIEGLVVVSFVIEKDGSISDIEIKRDIGGGCGDEAVRVINGMPKWTPGKQNGNSVRVAYNFPIRFELQD